MSVVASFPSKMFAGILDTPLNAPQALMLKNENFRHDDTAQKLEFFIKDFFSKCDQIRSFLRIWSHLLKKSLMENFIFCAVRANLRVLSFNN